MLEHIRRSALCLVLVAATLGSTASAHAQASCLRVSSAQGVVDAINHSDAIGQHITAVFTYDASTDPDQLLNQPGLYTSKVGFLDDRAPFGAASVEFFATRADRSARLVNLQRFSESSSQETYLATDRVLVRLPGGLSADALANYRSVLGQLCGSSDSSG